MISFNFRFSMKTLNLVILFWLIIFCLLFSCKQSKKDIPVTVSWSTNEPLSIPFRIRIQKYQHANLIRNSSFESGKELIIDTAGTTFRIDGWKKVGNSVEWVNVMIDSLYKADEAIDSLHSIKIHRTGIDETDERGEGIISDFIKVIPGNYSLSYYIKLENVCSSKERLGTKLYDAINIIIYYYDKNKIPISSKLYLPHKDMYIDNSFKGLSFSNYWQIEKFDWARVTGKSHNFNYPEGDIPDETRYVKIYFGMKGVGTMWLDNVDFRYTKSNFTALERMKYLTDTIFSKHNVIIPSPKEIEKYESIIYYEPGDDYKSLPKILVPEKITIETRNAAQLLKSKLESLYKSLSNESENYFNIRIVTRLSASDLNSSRIIFSVGKNLLYRRFREILPVNDIKNIPQAYFIYTNSDINNLIFLAGNRPIGDFYAVTTAIQLFDTKKFIFHNAKVIDYPDFVNRYYNLSAKDGIYDVLKNISYIDELTYYKINGAYLSVDLSVDSIKYKQITEGISSRYANSDIFNFKILLAPEIFFDYITYKSDLNTEDEQIRIININQDKLKNICNTGFNNGASGVVYVSWFVIPSQINLCQVKSPDNYFNISNALSRNVITISNIADDEYAGKDFGILLPWYNNNLIDDSRGNAEVLLERIMSGFPDKIFYFWTGNSSYSLKSDNADLERMKYYLKKIPVYWDNSVLTLSRNMNMPGYYSHYPGKVRLYNIFEPYNNNNIEVIIENIDKEQIFFNSTVNSELDLIKFATIADFSWNTKTYDPDLSLWKILLSRYGFEAAKLLIFINDEYFSLKETILKLNSEGLAPKLIKRGESIINNLNTGLKKLASIIGESHPLTCELRNKIEHITREYNELNSQLNFNQEKSQSIENMD
jgi:hypothetical protein